MNIINLAAGAGALPAVVGFARGASTDPARRPLWIWMIMLGIEDVCVRVVASNHIETWWLTWLSYPLAVWLGLAALLGFKVMVPLRRLRAPLFVAFLGVWIFGFFIGERATGFASYAAPVHALILAGLGVTLFIRSSTQVPTGPQRVPSLTGLATAITYGPFVAIWPLSSLLLEANRPLLSTIWQVRAALLIVGSLLFCVALWSRSTESRTARSAP